MVRVTPIITHDRRHLRLEGHCPLPPSKPPPATLVRRLVRARMAEIEAAAGKR
jgi:hypothetical protein